MTKARAKSSAKTPGVPARVVGPWVLRLEGFGPHNNGSSGDADQVLRAITEQLEAAGHVLSAASCQVAFGK